MPRRESVESVHDFGNTPLALHIFLSSCNNSGNVVFAGLEIPTRAYPGVERRVGRDGLETHAIKVLDQPCQILALQVWNGTSKLTLSNAAGELLVEVWRSCVEVAELL